MTYLVLAFALAAVLSLYVTWTASRIDRVHARCVAARANLDLQVVRRAAAVASFARDHAGDLGAHAALLGELARAALEADDDHRAQTENDLTKALREVPFPERDPVLEDVTAASRRIILARHIYNDAVRDTLTLRRRRWPRALRLGAAHPLPAYFDIDESLPGRPVAEITE